MLAFVFSDRFWSLWISCRFMVWSEKDTISLLSTNLRHRFGHLLCPKHLGLRVLAFRQRVLQIRHRILLHRASHRGRRQKMAWTSRAIRFLLLHVRVSISPPHGLLGEKVMEKPLQNHIRSTAWIRSLSLALCL